MNAGHPFTLIHALTDAAEPLLGSAEARGLKRVLVHMRGMRIEVTRCANELSEQNEVAINDPESQIIIG